MAEILYAGMSKYRCSMLENFAIKAPKSGLKQKHYYISVPLTQSRIIDNKASHGSYKQANETVVV